MYDDIVGRLTDDDVRAQVYYVCRFDGSST